MATARPTLVQYIAYSYGRRLPDSMRRWVAEDLAGQGAVRRHMIRNHQRFFPNGCKRSRMHLVIN
jgi:hypothetical protein